LNISLWSVIFQPFEEPVRADLQAPIQVKLIDLSLLSPKEHRWLNDYNQEVEEKLTPLLQRLGDERAIKWLQSECKPVEMVQ
jgi:hypothetical protein